MSDFNSKTDYEILSYIRSGDEKQIVLLIERYRDFVEQIVSRYSNSPMERDDLLQEGMIGLVAGIKSFDSAKGASFKTYAGTCIVNSINSALRKFNRLKDIPAQNVVEYQEELIPKNNSTISAEDTFIAKESVSMLTKALQQNLSDLENEVLRMHIVGCSYSEIAERLSKTPKAIDNALQRVRKKMSNILCEYTPAQF
jgi:RNA polymerase sporulation-specific sigma factor